MTESSPQNCSTVAVAVNTLLVSLTLYFIAAHQIMGPGSPYHCSLRPNGLCLQCEISDDLQKGPNRHHSSALVRECLRQAWGASWEIRKGLCLMVVLPEVVAPYHHSSERWKVHAWEWTFLLWFTQPKSLCWLWTLTPQNHLKHVNHPHHFCSHAWWTQLAGLEHEHASISCVTP